MDDSVLFRRLTAGVSQLTSDTVHVWSPGSVADSTWRGALVDTALYAELERFYPAFRPEARPFWKLYSVATISIASRVTGVVLRVPGKYEETRIELMVYDSTRARIVSHHLLADFWGDAGDESEDHSLLVDFDGDGARDIVLHSRRTWADEDEAGVGRSPIVHDSVLVRVWLSDGFTTPRLLDTLPPRWGRPTE